MADGPGWARWRYIVWAKLVWAKLIWPNSFGQMVLWTKFVRAKKNRANGPLDKKRLDKRSFRQTVLWAKIVWTKGRLDKRLFGQKAALAVRGSRVLT